MNLRNRMIRRDVKMIDHNTAPAVINLQTLKWQNSTTEEIWQGIPRVKIIFLFPIETPLSWSFGPKNRFYFSW